MISDLPTLPSTQKEQFSYSLGQKPSPSTTHRYPNYFELMAESIGLFVENFFLIIFFAIAPFLFITMALLTPIFILRTIVLNDLLPVPPSIFLIIPMVVVYVLFVIIGELWGITSYFYLLSHLGEKLTVGEILQEGFKKILPLFFLTFLLSLTILGGSFLFIIPGIITAFLSIFTFNVLFVEDLGGFSAIHTSRFRFQGHVLGLLFRLFLYAISVIILSGFITFLSKNPTTSDFASVLKVILYLVGPVITIIFINRNYQSLRWVSIGQSTIPSLLSKIIYFVFMSIPIVILLAVVFFIIKNPSPIISYFSQMFQILPKTIIPPNL